MSSCPTQATARSSQAFAPPWSMPPRASGWRPAMSSLPRAFPGKPDMVFELPSEQTGPAAWYGPEMTKRSDWLMQLTAAEIAEIESATHPLVARRTDIATVKPHDFPLPTLGPKLTARV